MGQSYLKNAALLTGADVLLRLAGMGLRIYLANTLGGEGMGLYQLVLAVYALFVTLATAGVSVAASTAVQRALTSCALPHSSAYQMIPIRTLCSTSWLSTLGSTRRRAIKNPRSTAERAIQGIPKADTRSAPAARTSPSHHRAAAPASPYLSLIHI